MSNVLFQVVIEASAEVTKAPTTKAAVADTEEKE